MAASFGSSPSGVPGANARPVHTRALEIELLRGERGKIRARGTILDLRKQGFVPTGGELQTSGIIHHMGVAARIDAESRVIESLEPSQPVVAFEASEMTSGESCRDIAGGLQELVGKPLDAGFARELSACFGGPRGCSHLLTLVQFLGSTLPHALAWEKKFVGGDSDLRTNGERFFKRSILLDGLDFDSEPVMDLVVQLNDVHSLPAAKVVNPMDRFLHQQEVKLAVRVDLQKMTFVSLSGDGRERNPENFAREEWLSLNSPLSILQGQPALRGLARSVMTSFGEAFPAAPLRDALLFIAPGLIQCLAARAQRVLESDAGSEQAGSSIRQLGGLPDSCYIWRAGGPGQQRRQGGPTSQGSE